MKKSRIATIGVTAVLAFGLVGWGTLAAGEEHMGVLAPEGSAAVAVSDQVGATDAVTIDVVRAPRDSWVVIHQSDGGMPGARVGLAAVPKGVTRDVVVELDLEVPMTPELLAAVHVDAGIRGEFEFDMDDDHSPDKPYFINGHEVAASFRAAEFGVPVMMDEAMIEVSDQRLGSSVVVDMVLAPEDAFVVVHKATEDEMPGERLGYVGVKQGETRNVEVELAEELADGTKLIAAIHADRGTAGKLEFDMERPVDSPDQPYFADGMEVAALFRVGEFGLPVSKASLEATDQVGATDILVVDRVVAPSDAWVVVHKDDGGMPGERVGIKRVEQGETLDVEVQLDSDVLTENVFVALHADRGVAEIFEFDMTDKFVSPDQPFFIGEEEVAIAIKVRRFGVPAEPGSASLSVSEQAPHNATVMIDEVVAPTPAWVVVHLDKGGVPGKRVGLVWVPAGRNADVVVQLDASVMLGESVIVALHADRGEAGLFEFDMADGVNSPDQPFFIGDEEVAVPLRLSSM